VGLVVGGVLAEWVSWRMGFFINMPIGVGLILAALKYINETERHPGKFDIPGALTSTAGMSALVYGFIRSAGTGWDDATTLITLASAVVLLVAFILIEGRAAQPILPLRLFASRIRSGAYGARILYLAPMVGFFFFTTLYLQEVLGLSPAWSGLAFVPATILHVPSAIAFPKLARRFGSDRLLFIGMIFGIAGMAWLSRAGIASSYWTGVALPMLLIGISQGLVLSPLTSAGVSGVRPELAGAAAGAVNVAHHIGSSVGLSVLVAIAVLGSGAREGRELTAYRVSTAFDAGTVMLLLVMLIVTLTIIRKKRAMDKSVTEAIAGDPASASTH
jgi:MFS family permease